MSSRVLDHSCSFSMKHTLLALPKSVFQWSNTKDLTESCSNSCYSQRSPQLEELNEIKGKQRNKSCSSSLYFFSSFPLFKLVHAHYGPNCILPVFVPPIWRWDIWGIIKVEWDNAGGTLKMKLVAFKEKEEIDGCPQHVRTLGKKPTVDKENVQYLANAVRLLAPWSWASQGQNCEKCMSICWSPHSISR